eukprot:TRINITY_DN8989_c0_g1_i2.p1 TRINITY_DN8989_c0_g1~~TRINITY_DN8989_c0_g1_i2.p1  ORF type:complete len:230 (+),score=-25.27 TRINITY_DN8989_c0_g1_i2:319-1008(+)
MKQHEIVFCIHRTSLPLILIRIQYKYLVLTRFFLFGFKMLLGCPKKSLFPDTIINKQVGRLLVLLYRPYKKFSPTPLLVCNTRLLHIKKSDYFSDPYQKNFQPQVTNTNPTIQNSKIKKLRYYKQPLQVKIRHIRNMWYINHISLIPILFLNMNNDIRKTIIFYDKETRNSQKIRKQNRTRNLTSYSMNSKQLIPPGLKLSLFSFQMHTYATLFFKDFYFEQELQNAYT